MRRARSRLLLPLALAAGRFGSPRLLTGVLLMAAYAPSLGGIATPVGTAPNLIGLRLLEQYAGTRPSFAAWCAVFAPLAVISTAGTAWLMAMRSRGGTGPMTDGARHVESIAPHGPWTRAERTLIPVFVAVVLLWITLGILAATPLAGPHG